MRQAEPPAWVGGDRLQQTRCGFPQHIGSARQDLIRHQGGPREVGTTWLADDPIRTDVKAEASERVISGRCAGGGHGVGGVVDPVGRNDPMQEAKEQRGHVEAVGDQSDGEIRDVDHAPEDVVVAVQLLGARVAEVGEGGGSGGGGVANLAG